MLPWLFVVVVVVVVVVVFVVVPASLGGTKFARILELFSEL